MRDKIHDGFFFYDDPPRYKETSSTREIDCN